MENLEQAMKQNDPDTITRLLMNTEDSKDIDEEQFKEAILQLFDNARNQEVIEITEQLSPVLEQTNPGLAAWLLSKASYSYYRLNDYENSQKLLDQAKALYEQNKDQAGILLCFTQIALRLRLQGQYEQADKVCRQALSVLDVNMIEQTDPEAAAEFYRVYGWVLENLGSARKEESLIQKGQQCLEKAKSIVENSKVPVSGRTRSELFYTLGTVDYSHRRWKEAKDSLEQALEFFEQTYGPQSVELCNTLNQLGACSEKLNDTESAAGNYKRSYEIRRNAYGEDNLLTTISKENWMRLKMKDYKEEEIPEITENLEQIAKTRKEICDSNSPWPGRVYSTLAGWLSMQNQFLEADQMYDQALNFFKNSSASEYGICLKNKGLNLEKANQHNEARKCYKQAKPYIEAGFPASHPAVEEIRRLLQGRSK